MNRVTEIVLLRIPEVEGMTGRILNKSAQCQIVVSGQLGRLFQINVLPIRC